MSEENARGESFSFQNNQHASQPLRLSVLMSQMSRPPPCQVMSIEEVERIMDETQDAIEYQRVSAGDSEGVPGLFLLKPQPYVLLCAANRRDAGRLAVAGG